MIRFINIVSRVVFVVLFCTVFSYKGPAPSGDFNRDIINSTPMAIKTCTQTNPNTGYKELEIKNVLQDRETYRPTRQAICAVKDITSPCVSCLSYDYMQKFGQYRPTYKIQSCIFIRGYVNIKLCSLYRVLIKCCNNFKTRFINQLMVQEQAI